MRPIIITIMLAALLATLPSGCTGAEWRTAHAIRTAGTATDRALAAAALRDHDRCKAAHKAQTKGYADCMSKSKAWAALQKWRKYIRPGINSGLAVAVAAFQIAERVKGGKADWKKLLSPSACGLARAAAEWKDQLGDAAQLIAVATAWIIVATCQGGE